MYLLNGKQISAATRDMLVDQVEKRPIWTASLSQSLYGGEPVDERKVKETFRKVVLECKEKNILAVPGGKKVAFHTEEDVQKFLKEVGKTFLCNIVVNNSAVYEHMNNFLILNLDVQADLIKCVSIHPTMFGLGTEVHNEIGDLDLSSDDEDSDFFPDKSPPLPVFTEAEDTRPFSPNLCEETPGDANEEGDCAVQHVVKTELRNEDDVTSQAKTKEKKDRKRGSNKRKTVESTEGKKTPKKKKRKEEQRVSKADMLNDLSAIVANLNDIDMKNTDMTLLAEHLNAHTTGVMKKTCQLMDENIPKIYETFQVIVKYTLNLHKMLKRIPYEINEAGVPTILCSGCHIHCVGNWNIPNPPGRPMKDPTLK